jgi:hypothetical protein
MTSGLQLGDICGPEKCLFLLALFSTYSRQTAFSIDLVGHVGTERDGLYLLGGCRTMDSGHHSIPFTDAFFLPEGSKSLISLMVNVLVSLVLLTAL